MLAVRRRNRLGLRRYSFNSALGDFVFNERSPGSLLISHPHDVHDARSYCLRRLQHCAGHWHYYGTGATTGDDAHGDLRSTRRSDRQQVRPRRSDHDVFWLIEPRCSGRGCCVDCLRRHLLRWFFYGRDGGRSTRPHGGKLDSAGVLQPDLGWEQLPGPLLVIGPWCICLENPSGGAKKCRLYRFGVS